MYEPVVIANFRTRLEAESAGGLLEHEGIPFVIQSSEGMGLGPLSGGASVLVRDDQADQARRVLVDAGLIEEASA